MILKVDCDAESPDLMPYLFRQRGSRKILYHEASADEYLHASRDICESDRYSYVRCLPLAKCIRYFEATP